MAEGFGKTAHDIGIEIAAGVMGPIVLDGGLPRAG